MEPKLVKPGTQLGGIANLALMAPVRPGFVPGAEGFSYARRLEALFKTLAAIRLASREAMMHGNPFPDAVGRWGLLQSFRYALVPPPVGDDQGELLPSAPHLGTWRLYLNVGFDAGGEPYLRVIYRDLGPLLDTIFANCTGYLPSQACSFERYMRWVRSREAQAGIFYNESSLTVPDQRYLAEVERRYRESDMPCATRNDVAALSLPPEDRNGFGTASPKAQGDAVVKNLRALKGLYDLRAAYPDNADGDEATLRRFVRDAMSDFLGTLPLLEQSTDNSVKLALQMFPAALVWADPRKGGAALPAPLPSRDLPRPASQIQAGILTTYDGVTHGVLLLLAVTDAEQARARLAQLPVTWSDAPPQAGQPYVNVAITRQGLQALGHAQTDRTLARFPQDFIDGMEARAGLLGDVRGNHPDQWQRPRSHGVEVDLRSVHVVLQFRVAADPSDPAALHPLLQPLLAAWSQAPGLRLLAAEPMRSRLQPDGRTREHFGFIDGRSQPRVLDEPAAPSRPWDDTVNPGEILLGHVGDHGDGPMPSEPDPLLDNGSFLVLRKIEQHVGVWRDGLRRAAKALEPGFDGLPHDSQQRVMDDIAGAMMGRNVDGQARVPTATPGGNDFDYGADPKGQACPFASHVRRTNPRANPGPQARVPRLMRRGMSFGPDYDAEPGARRGLFFMAYCASIAEQFEVVQRWISGGNSTGVLSTHADPLLGVPDARHPRSFQWQGTDGQVKRVDLWADALTQLHWGLYLFAPSRDGLSALCAAPVDRPLPLPDRLPQPAGCPWPANEPRSPQSADFERWRRLVQDSELRDELWAQVRQRGGVMGGNPYGRLVADPQQVLAILQDDGKRHSVCGFGRRFRGSVGDGFLGMDAPRHTRLAEDSGINLKVATLLNEADCFHDAYALADAFLRQRVPAGFDVPIPVDLIDFHERLLAQLCQRWFGVPDAAGQFMRVGTSAEPVDDQPTPVCPRDFVFVARHIFGAHPTALERQRGIDRGALIKKQMRAYIDDQLARPADQRQLTPLAAFVAQALENEGPDTIAQTLSGLMLGFAPSVHGNFSNVMRDWVEPKPDGTPTVWDLQQALLAANAAGNYASTCAALRQPLLDRMAKALVPATVWRERRGAKPKQGMEPDKVIVGLHGAMTDPGIDPELRDALMFGGTVRGLSEDARFDATHACPGRGTAIGTLMGGISALLTVGTIKPSPSPTILYLMRARAL